jgi:hypothetical protein
MTERAALHQYIPRDNGWTAVNMSNGKLRRNRGR